MYKCKEQLGCSGRNITPYSKDGELKFELCKDCGIIWRTNDSAHITKPYEEDYFISKKYLKKRRHKVEKSGWLIDIGRLNHPDISSVLEIGCSIGYTLEAAKKRNIGHLGIDISNYAVDFCNSLGLNASFTTLGKLKQDGQKFDLIFMQHVLEHFEDPFSTLKECHSLLNNKGRMVILVPNANYKRANKFRSKHRFYSMKGVGSEHFAYFSYANLPKVLEVSGFKTIQQNYPVFIDKYDSPKFFVNRFFRHSLAYINSDQELFVVAEKVG